MSYCAAAVFTAAGLVFTMAGGAEGYRRSQDNEYRRAMAMLVTSMSSADAALEQGQYAVGSEITGRICAELMSAARSASTALSILPLETNALEELAEFLSRLEEYARVKGETACSGRGFTEADRETAGKLRTVTAELVPVLGNLYRHLAEGGLSVHGLMHRDGVVTDEAEAYLEQELLALLENFPDVPELVYAGKLSDDFDDSYTLVADMDKVSEERALEVAAGLAGDGANVAYMGNSFGSLPCYYFGGETEQGSVTVSVTCRGGLPMLYLREYAPNGRGISDEEAAEAALLFAETAGYEGLQVYDSREEAGLLKLRLVYAEEGAVHPDDGVDVGVALDTGEVVSMNASDYLHNHGGRTTEAKPVLTAAQAAAVSVPDGVEIRSEELTWFTGDTGTTTLCWRFDCTVQNGKCTIYAAADTGRQVEIRVG